MSNLGDNTVERSRPTVNDGVRQTSEETVVIACKLPNGLILQCDEPYEASVPVFGKTETVSMYRRGGQTYKVNGSAVDLARMEIGDIPHTISAGFGLTYGVPKSFWERWLSQHKEMEIVEKKFIFAMNSESNVRSKTKELKNITTGLEPIDPSNPAKRTGIKRIMTGVRE